MAGKRISAFSEASSIQTTDLFVTARPGEPGNRKATPGTVRKTLIPSGGAGDVPTFKDYEAPYSTGTIQIVATTGGSVVTLTGGSFPTWAASGDLVVSGELYSVLSRTDATHLVLDDATINVAAGTSYELRQRDLVAQNPRWRVLAAASDDSGDYSATTPTLPITGATNTTPIQITCVNHRLKTGQHVRIYGVGGNTAANNKSVGSGPTGAGYNSASPENWEVDAGTTRIVDATNATPIVISTFPIRHQLVTGDIVRIDGVKGNDRANSGYSTGTVTITPDAGGSIVNLADGSWPDAAADGYLVVGDNQYSVLSRASATQIRLDNTAVTAAAGTLYQLWIGFQVTVTSAYAFSLNNSVGSGSYDGGGTVSFFSTFKLKQRKNNTRVAITATASGYSSRFRLTTTTAHGFTDYDRVIVEGCGGNAAAANNSTSNDTWAIDVIDSTNIDLIGSTYAAGGTFGTVELAFMNQLADVAGNGTYTSGGTMIRPARIKIWATSLTEADFLGFKPGVPIRMKTAENGYSYGVIGSIPGYEGYPITRDFVSPKNVAYELTFAGPPLQGNLTELAIGSRPVVQLEMAAVKHPYYGSSSELPLSQLIQNAALVEKWRMTGGGTVLGTKGDRYNRWVGGNAYITAYQVVHREPATAGAFGQTGVGTTVTIIPDSQRPINADGIHTDGSTKRGAKVTRSAAFADQGDGRTGCRGYIFNKTYGDPKTISSSTAATPIVVTTTANHGYSTGAIITIFGCDDPAVNGRWKITVTAVNQFSLQTLTGANSTSAATGSTGTIIPDIVESTVVSESKQGSEFLVPIIDASYGAAFTLTNGDATGTTTVNILKAGHGRKTGELVQIKGMTGKTGVNGIWKITVVDANNYTLDGATGSAGASVGGDFTYPITLSTSKAHGQSDGTYIRVHGVPGNTNANGTWRVDSLSSTTLGLFQDTGKTITSTTAAAPISVACTGHGLSTGDIVRIFNCGNVIANAVWVITKTDNDNFTLDGSVGTGGTTQGGGQLCTSRAGNSAFTGYRAPKTITAASYATPISITSASHGLSNGDQVVISGVKGNLAANGLWTVANTAANTFDLTDYDGNSAIGSGYYSGGGQIEQAGGYIQNGLLNTEFILESMTMSGAALTPYELQDEARQPAINLDVGGQLLSPNDFYRGQRPGSIDNLFVFSEADEVNRESYDVVHGTRLEVACTSIGNRPGPASDDTTGLGGAEFLSVFLQVVEE